MTTAQEILKLIEEVSPDDTAKLDEIDAMVYAYLKLHDGFKVSVHKGGRSITYRHNSWGQEHPSVLLHLFDGYQVTRSRDALKQIRPEGWRLSVDGIAWVGVETKKNISQDKFACSLLNWKRDAFVNSYGLPTEELAELAAIIQAIEYERNNA